MTKLRQRLRFNLADTLTSHVEILPDFLERALLARLVQTKPHLDDFFLTRREGREHIFSQLAKVVDYRGLCRISGTSIFDEAGDHSFTVVADWSFERDRLLGDLQSLAYLPCGHVHATGKLLVSRLSAKLL